VKKQKFAKKNASTCLSFVIATNNTNTKINNKQYTTQKLKNKTIQQQNSYKKQQHQQKQKQKQKHNARNDKYN